MASLGLDGSPGYDLMAELLEELERARRIALTLPNPKIICKGSYGDGAHGCKLPDGHPGMCLCICLKQFNSERLNFVDAYYR